MVNVFILNSISASDTKEEKVKLNIKKVSGQEYSSKIVRATRAVLIKPLALLYDASMSFACHPMVQKTANVILFIFSRHRKIKWTITDRQICHTASMKYFITIDKQLIAFELNDQIRNTLDDGWGIMTLCSRASTRWMNWCWFNANGDHLEHVWNIWNKYIRVQPKYAFSNCKSPGVCYITLRTARGKLHIILYFDKLLNKH